MGLTSRDCCTYIFCCFIFVAIRFGLCVRIVRTRTENVRSRMCAAKECVRSGVHPAGLSIWPLHRPMSLHKHRSQLVTIAFHGPNSNRKQPLSMFGQTPAMRSSAPANPNWVEGERMKRERESERERDSDCSCLYRIKSLMVTGGGCHS